MRSKRGLPEHIQRSSIERVGSPGGGASLQLPSSTRVTNMTASVPMHDVQPTRMSAPGAKLLAHALEPSVGEGREAILEGALEA